MAVGRWGESIEAAATDERRAGDGPESGRRVVLGPGGQLVGQSRTHGSGLLGPQVQSARDQGDLLGVAGAPVLVPPGVEQLYLPGDPGVVVQGTSS